jgi:hypothetical protein
MSWILDKLLDFILGVMPGLFTYLKQKIQQRRFKKIFGNDIIGPNNFHLVYGEFILCPQIDGFLKTNGITHPYQKPANNAHVFSISKQISIAEVRAANYLSSVIGAQAKSTPVLSSDIGIKDKLDLGFISFGGPGGNHKSNDVSANNANQLVAFDGSQIISISSKKPILTTANLTNDYNYGLILKLHPEQFPNRVWIMCAGFNEWGTSGAAYYLANKWQEIYKWAKDSNFAIIVKVRNEQDESAEVYKKAKTPEEVEKFI